MTQRMEKVKNIFSIGTLYGNNGEKYNGDWMKDMKNGDGKIVGYE